MNIVQDKTFNKGRVINDSECAYIRKHFTYNPDTGIITRDDRNNSNGSYDNDGYLILKVKTRQIKAHRIAWFLFYGEFPNMEIDHINRDRSDNRIVNLRLSTRETNVANRKVLPNPQTGVVGIYLDHYTKGLKKKFTTRIKGKTFRFYSLEEAINFRKENGYAI